MREDVLHVWRARKSIRVMHLGDSAIGVRREVRDCQAVLTNGQQRLVKDWDAHRRRFCNAPVLENRLQDRVSEVHAVGIREQQKAIEPEDVEGV